MRVRQFLSQPWRLLEFDLLGETLKSHMPPLFPKGQVTSITTCLFPSMASGHPKDQGKGVTTTLAASC